MRRVVGIAVLSMILAACARGPSSAVVRPHPNVTATVTAYQATATARPTPAWVTINGYGLGNQLTDPVIVWDDYQARTRAVAFLHDGNRVKLIQRLGAAVEVETMSGIRGWLSYLLISE